MRLASTIGILLTLTLASSCNDSEDPSHDPEASATDERAAIESAVRDHLEQVKGGRARGGAAAAGSRFAAGVSRFEMSALEIAASGSEAVAKGKLAIDWEGEKPGARLSSAQALSLALSRSGASWRVERVESAEAPAEAAVVEEQMTVPEVQNPTFDDRTRIEAFRLVVSADPKRAGATDLATRLAALLAPSLSSKGLSIDVADAAPGALPLAVSIDQAELVGGYPVFAEARFAARISSRVPFVKPAGSWQFEYSWRWTARSIGFGDTEAAVHAFVEDAAKDLADRFAAALASKLGEFARAEASPIRAAWALPRERALVDIAAGAPASGPRGTVLVRTRGQQIQAFGTGADRLWAAGQVQWPEKKDDPLAYPPFTHVPPLVRADGSAIHAVVDPDPPHSSWIVEVDARGKEGWSNAIEGVPCSGVVDLDGTGLAVAVWRPDEVVGAQGGGRVHVVRLGPDGKEARAADTGWTAASPAAVEIVPGTVGSALVVGSGRMVLLDVSGSAAWRVEGKGIEPYRHQVLERGGEFLRVDGGRVVAGGPEGAAVIEVDGTLDWIRPGEGDRLLAGEGKVAYAFSRQGGLFWRAELAEAALIPPLADGGFVYLGSWKRFFALRAADGTLAWETRIRGQGCRWPPVVAGEGEARAILLLGAVRTYLDPEGRR